MIQLSRACAGLSGHRAHAFQHNRTGLDAGSSGILTWHAESAGLTQAGEVVSSQFERWGRLHRIQARRLE